MKILKLKKTIEKIIKEVREGKKVKRYKLEDMNIFKLGDKIFEIIWEIVSDWKLFLKNTLGSQMVRASDSMIANIAEGYGRYFVKDNILFLYYSRASAYEKLFWLDKAYKMELITTEFYKNLRTKIENFILEINKLIKTIKGQVDKFGMMPWWRYKRKSNQ